MKKEKRRLIAVASGFPTKQFRSSESLKLLNWGFRNTNTFEISKKNETIFELDTWLGTSKKIKASTKEDYYLTINKKEISHLTVSLEYDGPILAPVIKGTQIATREKRWNIELQCLDMEKVKITAIARTLAKY